MTNISARPYFLRFHIIVTSLLHLLAKSYLGDLGFRNNKKQIYVSKLPSETNELVSMASKNLTLVKKQKNLTTTDYAILNHVIK